MFAKLQFECRRLSGKRSRTYPALLLFYGLLVVLRFGAAACAQEQVKVEPPKTSTTSPDSKKEQQPQDKAASSDANSTGTAEPGDPAQAKLLRDARRLQTLSRELQAEILNSKPDTLSVASIKKLDELQKLAITVKAEIGKTH